MLARFSLPIALLLWKHLWMSDLDLDRYRQLKREVLFPNCRLRGNIARRLLFRSQRLHRINFSGAMCGEQTCSASHSHEQQNRSADDKRIVRTHLE